MSQKLIDLHIAHMPDEISKIQDTISLISDSCLIHHIGATEGSIFDTRHRGFTFGRLPYVAFGDPDDWFLTNPFPEMVEILERGEHSMVYTNSYTNKDAGTLLYKDHVWTPEYHFSRALPIHQVVLMRRDLLEEAFRNIINIADTPLLEALNYRANSVIYTHVIRYLPAFFLNTAALVWNQDGNNSHRLCPDEDRKLLYRHINEQRFESYP